MDVPMSKFSTLLERSWKRMGVRILLLMEDQAKSDDHYSRKEIQSVCVLTPENLKLVWAKCCTPKILSTWYRGFKIYLEEHNLLNKTTQIWNANEAGFLLCATSGKVLSICGCRFKSCITIGYVSHDIKIPTYFDDPFSTDQFVSLALLTKHAVLPTRRADCCLCAVSASGETVPPMQIFSGMRFKFKFLCSIVSMGHTMAILHLAGARQSCFIAASQIILPKWLYYGQLFYTSGWLCLAY